MSDTRPSPDTPEELIWLRGFEAGVIRCRADRNQVIRELIEKAEADPTQTMFTALWLKSQLEGGE